MPQNKFKREYVGGKEFISDDLINLIMCDIVQIKAIKSHRMLLAVHFLPCQKI